MDRLERLIDANANRASEGIRVLEDLARFVLDRADLCARLKDERHALRAALPAIGSTPERRLASRDTAHDAGTTISTQHESDRSDDRSVAIAGAKRAQEALRALEEVAKVRSGSGAAFERIRYALYDLERDVVLALREPCPQWRVCVLLTRALCAHHTPERVLDLAREGGAEAVQIREKTMDDAELFPHAIAIADRARSIAMRVVVNDRADLAIACGADALHLGQRDMPIGVARSIVGPRVWIGRSCASIEQADRAIDEGADTLGIGPIFPSRTKPKPAPRGVELARDAAALCRTRGVSMLAISGIDGRTIGPLVEAGCPGVAVSACVCGAEDPRAVCAELVGAWDGAPALQ